MNAADCSCRVTTNSIPDVRNDSTVSRFSSPGTPKTRSTPSFANAATNRSEPFIIRPAPHVRHGPKRRTKTHGSRATHDQDRDHPKLGRAGEYWALQFSFEWTLEMTQRYGVAVYCRTGQLVVRTRAVLPCWTGYLSNSSAGPPRFFVPRAPYASAYRTKSGLP